MEKIEHLLEQLNNRIPSSMANRLDDLDDLHDKLELAGQEYDKNSSDENRDKYNEVMEYVEEIEQGIVKDLQALLQKKKAEQLAKEQKANEPAPAPAPTPNPSVNPTTEKKEEKEEKKEGSGVLALVIGGALLVASFGAINFFRRR